MMDSRKRGALESSPAICNRDSHHRAKPDRGNGRRFGGVEGTGGGPYLVGDGRSRQIRAELGNRVEFISECDERGRLAAGTRSCPYASGKGSEAEVVDLELHD